MAKYTPFHYFLKNRGAHETVPKHGDNEHNPLDLKNEIKCMLIDPPEPLLSDMNRILKKYGAENTIGNAGKEMRE